MPKSTAGLRRELGLRDLLLLSIVAVYTPNAVAQTAPLGSAGYGLWVLGILTYLLPLTAAIADLAVRHPVEGGIYAWTKTALGGFHGYFCAWCYWVNTFYYLPTVFLTVAAVLPLLGRNGVWELSADPRFTALAACAAFWLVTGLHLLGLGRGKWPQNLGSISRLIMAAALITLGLWHAVRTSPEAPLAARAVGALPFWSAVALWPLIINALVGLELGPIMSEEVAVAPRTIPKVLFGGAILVALCYLLGYVAMQMLGMPDPDKRFGHLQAILAVTQKGALAWLGIGLVIIEAAGMLGLGAAWSGAPARVPLAVGLDHYLPEAFGRVHPKFGSPYVALLTQGLIVTVLIVVNSFESTVQEAYLALLNSSIVLGLVPYIYLFVSWSRLSRAPGSSWRARPWSMAGSLLGLAATATAIAAGFIPAAEVQNVVLYELKVVSSVFIMTILGVLLYAFEARKRSRRGVGTNA